VVVNGVEIPEAVQGTNMTSTGWYNLVSAGALSGGFNLDFDGGDPYGSMAYLAVVVPNRVSDARGLPRVSVLLQGRTLAVYGTDGAGTGQQFTNNPAWVLLDVLRRGGWTMDEIDAASFAAAAGYCGTLINSAVPMQPRDAAAPRGGRLDPRNPQRRAAVPQLFRGGSSAAQGGGLAFTTARRDVRV